MTPSQTPEAGEAWLARSRATVAALPLAARAQALGRLEHIADGIAQVSGLPDARLDEVLHFNGGSVGFALTLDAERIGAVLLDEGDAIEAGSTVTGTGEVLRVPVGPGLLGRVVDPLGRPLDRDEAVLAEAHMPIERAAPAIADRAAVTEPVHTGVLVVDALFAIGRGQRELIIGDRATGKTSLALDTIINQKHSNMVCIYIAVGQRANAVRQVIEAVRTHGAPERCVFVVASASDPAGLQWLAPFAGFTVAEYFRDRGQHVLVVIDDLTKHAATHRELALLTHQPPGREAYPGDIFYLHARLLERAAKLSPELGSGSLTALPIVQTEAGALSAYIPTNLISITDGQIVLDGHLFAANLRPAVEVGLSVSRIGGKAQTHALRVVSGRLRLNYSQFLELEMFTRFGGLGDSRVKTQIARGERIRALLTQPRFAALRLSDQIALLAALDAGVLDAHPPKLIAELRRRLAAQLDAEAAAIAKALDAGGELNAATRDTLVEVVRRLAESMTAVALPGAS